MLLGSSTVLADTPSSDDGQASIDQQQQSTEMLKPKPGGRRNGAGFFILK